MAEKKKASFVLYHDIRGPLELLTDDERGKLFLAILDYSEYGALPEFDGALQMAFAFIRTALDRDAMAWEDKREKRRVAGSMGGKQRVANQANATFACDVQANQAVPVPVPVPAPAPVPVIEGGADKPPTRPRFSPPSVEEVAEYVREKGYHINPYAFVNHYEAVGWKVGKNSMKNWKAAVNTWENREKGAEHGQLEGRTRNDIPKIPNPLEGYFD